MTQTLPGADIRGFYSAIGVPIPDWARGENATVRCFAAADHHAHDDRSPSMSIDIAESGAFICHTCGARGGAFDAAAVHRGYTDRAAIDLMIEFGLTTRRTSGVGRRGTPRPSVQRSSEPHRHLPSVLATDPAELRSAQARLLTDAHKLDELRQRRGWTTAAISSFGLGLDSQHRIAIPVNDRRGALVAMLRYRPRGPRPKMLADRGSQRVLYPHPTQIAGDALLIVEGEPDAIAAHSRGLPAVAIPGVRSWRPEWAELFRGRHVVVALDADDPGRICARRVAADLLSINVPTRTVELGRGRIDGYDLTDWLLTHPGTPDALLDELRSVEESAA